MSLDSGTKITTNQLVRKGISTSINSQTFLVYERNSSGITDCSGAAVPTDAGSGFAIGCNFSLTTGNGVGTTNYTNEGSASSCDFNSVTLPETGDISSVVAGLGLQGGGTSGAVTLDLGAGRGTTVRADAVDAGVDVYNQTGGTLDIGTLVNLSGFNTTLGVTMTLADADAGILATHVVLDVIGATSAGVVYPLGLGTGLNTAGKTIGDAVYLDTNAGAYTYTAQSSFNAIDQKVGVVKVVDAAVGEIFFFPGSGDVRKIGQNQIQNGAVGSAQIGNGAVTPQNLGQRQTLTSTADGLTTGQMQAMSQHAVVTSASATNWITLPQINNDMIGKTFTLWVGANGFELVTKGGSSETINTVNSDGTNQVDIPASTLTRCTAVDTATWVVESLTELGAVATALIPDND